jgi:hypothetical protein
VVDSDLAKKNSTLFIGGVIGILVGGFFTALGLIVSAKAATVLGSLIFLGSIGTIIYGLTKGLSMGIGANDKQPEESHDGAYIMNKLVVDRRGETVYDPDMHNPEDLKYLLQVQFETGRKSEFETSPLVFHGIGEGQKGTIVVQGRWVSQFTFRPESSTRPGDDRTFEAPYRPGT